MPKYRVFYTITGSAYADIQAPSIEKAMEKAEQMGGEEFTETDDRDWELDKDYTMNEQPEEFRAAQEKAKHHGKKTGRG